MNFWESTDFKLGIFGNRFFMTDFSKIITSHRHQHIILMKQLVTLLFLLLPLLTNAGSTIVTVTPEIPDNTEFPPQKRMPPKAPVVTISDNNILKVEGIPQDAELEISILENGSEIIFMSASAHEIPLPFLQIAVSYKLILSINGFLWSGYFYLD